MIHITCFLLKFRPVCVILSKMKNRFAFFLKFAYLVLDAVVLIASFSAASYLRHGIFFHPAYNKLLLPMIFITLIMFYHYKFYSNLLLTYVYELFRVIRSFTISFILILSITFYWRPFSYSRLMFTYFWAIGIAAIFLEREILKFVFGFLIRKIFRPDKVLVIGRGKIVRALRHRLKRMHQAALWINHYPEEDKLREIIVNRGFTEIIIAQFPVNHVKAVSIANICEHLGISFQLVPDILELKLGDLVIDEFFGIPLLKLKPTPLMGTHLLIKNICDVSGSILIITLLMPAFVLIAAAIKLTSRGPVIYSQLRRGKMGRDFKFFKFRTMIDGADKIFENERKEHYKRRGLLFKLKNDLRITGVGKILREWSVDEFPQILNVLKGNMSLVGPRPQIISEAKQYDSSALRRLRIKPGITGLWQVSGRSDLSYDEMVRLDLFYVQHWSVEEDFSILLRTIPAMLFKKGAY